MNSIAYVVLRCSSLETSRAWFEALGFQLTAETHPPGPMHYSMNLAGVVLELYPLRNKSTSGLRLGLYINDPERADERALRTGGERLAADHQSIVLRDPDGHTIELIAND